MRSILLIVLSLNEIGERVAKHRRDLRLTQSDLAERAALSRSSLDALENGRAGELGYNKILRILSVLGLDLEIRPIKSRRPTLEDLREEQHDQGLERRR